MSNVTLHPRPPFVGDILDYPVDKTIKRAFYTDQPDMSTRIRIDPGVTAEVKKPRLGDQSIMDLMKRMMSGGGSVVEKKETTEDGMKTTTIAAAPSNMDHRK